MARILVIDDDEAIRTMLRHALQKAGHEVFLGANGREGIDQYRANQPDLIITDIYMPGTEGIETIIEFHRRSSEIRIIAMSGKPTADVMLGIAQRLGAVAVLLKPFSIGELLQAVEKAL